MSIDTSKMSKGKADALEIAEAARDEMTEKSLAGGLYVGEFNYKNAYPFPEQDTQDKYETNDYVTILNEFFEKEVDPNEIDRSGEIPDSVFKGLADLKAFALKVPKSYGGKELSQMGYSRGAMVTGKYCGNIAALLSAHQSIGVPQPLLMYGTAEQKEKYLPKFAEGAVSAFALTEHDVGSDPGKLTTVAEPTEDGEHYIINGEKLWCTNGVKADVIIVMARTPDKIVGNRAKKQITAFIVDMDAEGVEIKHRCRFMGLKALYNGVINFKDVKVSKAAIVDGLGKGMRVALNTLNIGRLTIPAICVGTSKECLKMTRDWASTRVQWGQAVGKHQLLTDKISKMVSDIFAMEAMVEMCANLVDRKNCDIRVESAVAKMWATETYWRIIDDTMQIKGGRGYETAQSLESRGDTPDPIERMFRDARINLIFEGSSEIMRLILAREALDPHLKIAGDVLNSRAPWSKRIKAAFKSALHYSVWYPKQIFNSLFTFRAGVKNLRKELSKYIRYVRRESAILALNLFHSMLRYGRGLDKQQLTLSRLTEIGSELFVISSAVFKADMLIKQEKDVKGTLLIVDTIFNNSKDKIKNIRSSIWFNSDNKNYKLGRKVLDGDYKSMESVVNQPK